MKSMMKHMGELEVIKRGGGVLVIGLVFVCPRQKGSTERENGKRGRKAKIAGRAKGQLLL